MGDNKTTSTPRRYPYTSSASHREKLPANGVNLPSKRKSQRSLKRDSPPSRESSRLGGLFFSVDSGQHSLGHFTPLLPLALIVTSGALSILRPALPELLLLSQFLRCQLRCRQVEFADELQVNFYLLAALSVNLLRLVHQNLVHKLVENGGGQLGEVRVLFRQPDELVSV